MADLINEKEAALRLGLSPATLRAWRSQRRGPPYKRVGEAIRYDPDELDAFVQSERPGESAKKKDA